ncbi:MAG: C10 family peptidase [Bacteroidales bacterium]|nr:C10 family peptidase [Bacteroidales bacterium]
MKTINITLALLPVVLFFSCSKDSSYFKNKEYVTEIITKSTNNSAIKTITPIDYNTKEIAFEKDGLNHSYFVEMSDILSYIHYNELANGKRIIVNIESFSINGAVLFYVINYDKGWEILSADKRSQYLLGYSDSGQITMEGFMDNPKGIWLYSLALDILNLRLMDNEPESLSDNDNYLFWAAITHPEAVISAMSSAPPPVGYPGHYELSDVTIYYEDITVPHLIQTYWDQDGNEYVPYKSPSSSERCPSGCVAVAGAQVLKYLHDELGVPQYAPDSATCSGHGGEGNYSTNQWGESADAWDEMQADGRDRYSMILMAYIGRLTQTTYNASQSGAYYPFLKTRVFEYYDINCERDRYDSSTIYSEIVTKGMPVIVSASSNRLFFDDDVHCFIIDGVKYRRKTTMYTYEWIYDVQLGDTPLPSPRPPQVEYEFESSITHVQMNWGWGENNDNSYLSASGDWRVSTAGHNYNFRNDREMIYGFSID